MSEKSQPIEHPSSADEQLPAYSALENRPIIPSSSAGNVELPPIHFTDGPSKLDRMPESSIGLDTQTDPNLPLHFLGEMLDPPPTNEGPAINVKDQTVFFSGEAVGSWRLYSRSNKALPTEHAQYFIGGDSVSGYIDLSLTKPFSVESITVTLKGSMILNGSVDGIYEFLELPVAIWSRANGDPRQLSGDKSSQPVQPFRGKLEGDYRFGFSFPFPTEIEIPSKKNTDVVETSPTPPSFLSKIVFANIQYELILNIVHGMFRTSDKTQTIVQFLPRTLPAPSSPLRQLAYEQRGRLSSPIEDSEGWHSVGNVVVPGRLSANRDADVICTMYLANPLCYTRGTVIPCFLKLHSSELQPDALDMISQINVPAVRLVCRVIYYRSNAWAAKRQTSHMFEEVNEIQPAVWWKPTGVQNDHHDRYLEGEIHLANYLQPSSMFHALIVKYTVELSSLESPILKPPVSHTKGPLLSQYITIANFHGYGPIPTGFTPRVLIKPKPYIWGIGIGVSNI